MSGWAVKHAPFLARLCSVYTFNYLNYVYFAEQREFLFFARLCPLNLVYFVRLLLLFILTVAFH